jgi:hypothetical protein
MAGGLSSCRDDDGNGMSDGNSARQAQDQDLAQNQAKALRDHATSLLQQGFRTKNSVATVCLRRRDVMLDPS